ncbi:hypothetical protein HAX54_016022 [Datura stramonium]|uniref:Uncharacterized protein n=1 Tax=Datura stramonium TaxID=4076 RepID=A0ABS8RZR4_DATST|nr:hypothetical protein [Datura stramonium]
MGRGEKHHHHHHLKFHLPFHLHHGHIEELRDIPKGCVAVLVGEGEEQQRFVIPVMHINHPLFLHLLKAAEDEVEFRHTTGPINIPCHVDEFRHVEAIIHEDNNHHFWCFKP